MITYRANYRHVISIKNIDPFPKGYTYFNQKCKHGRSVMPRWLDVLTKAGVIIILAFLVLLALAVIQPFVWPMD